MYNSLLTEISQLHEVFLKNQTYLKYRCFANVSDFAPIPIGNKHKATSCNNCMYYYLRSSVTSPSILITFFRQDLVERGRKLESAQRNLKRKQ